MVLACEGMKGCCRGGGGEGMRGCCRGGGEGRKGSCRGGGEGEDAVVVVVKVGKDAV